MLVSSTEQFVRTHFVDEAEIERVVEQFADQLFGSSIVYLPQARLSTVGGRGTVPDALVIDVQREEWFVVEAERAAHGTWEHIAPQVSRHLAAVASPETREHILELALTQIGQTPALQAVVAELDINQLDIHAKLQSILRRPPTVAIPIDAIPRDLTEWARTLRNTVWIWVIEKFVSVSDSSRVLYSIPDETVPTISTEPSTEGTVATVRASGSQLWRELLEAMPDLLGTPVFLEYGPRGTQRRKFEATIREDGVEISGNVCSPSLAAVLCMKQAGSQRRTANGWVMWKTEAGEYLSDLYQRTQDRAT